MYSAVELELRSRSVHGHKKVIFQRHDDSKLIIFTAVTCAWHCSTVTARTYMY